MRISDWSSDVCSSDLQIQPKLETFHPAFFLLRQLGMHQAATCRHPLHAAILQQAFVAAAVTMTHTAIYHVGNGLKAAMGMIRKASDIVLRSEERRVGKGCVRTCRSRRSPYH